MNVASVGTSCSCWQQKQSSFIDESKSRCRRQLSPAAAKLGMTKKAKKVNYKSGVEEDDDDNKKKKESYKTKI